VSADLLEGAPAFRWDPPVLKNPLHGETIPPGSPKAQLRKIWFAFRDQLRTVTAEVRKAGATMTGERFEVITRSTRRVLEYGRAELLRGEAMEGVPRRDRELAALVRADCEKFAAAIEAALRSDQPNP
jgi:hypothetical protein